MKLSLSERILRLENLILEKQEDIYSIKKSGGRSDKVITGTLEYLIKYFSYTLISGNSYDSRIKKNPRTIKELVTMLNKAVNVTQNSYNNDYYTQVKNP